MLEIILKYDTKNLYINEEAFNALLLPSGTGEGLKIDCQHVAPSYFISNFVIVSF